MGFDAEKFCQDYNIEYWTDGKNVTAGWVNVKCPHCDDHSNHGGFDTDKGYFNCWKCGWHPMDDTIRLLVDLPWPEVYSILDKYSGSITKKERKIITPESIELPFGTAPMSERHKYYLRRRGFDPEYLEREYDLRGTGHIGKYAFRVIIPIYYQGRLVSYDSRDITNKQESRYKACDKNLEIIPRKNILYNVDRAQNRRCVVVEGPIDVWRLGPGAVATFGISFTTAQVLLLCKLFDYITILYDPEEQAQMQADKLAWEINSLGKETIIYELEGVDDPGSMPDDDARALMCDALKN